MTRIVNETVVAIAGSVALSLVIKVTVVIACALIATGVARRGRASVRHLILGVAFIALLGLPFGALIGPSIQVRLPLLEQLPASAIVAHRAAIVVAIGTACGQWSGAR